MALVPIATRLRRQPPQAGRGPAAARDSDAACPSPGSAGRLSESPHTGALHQYGLRVARPIRVETPSPPDGACRAPLRVAPRRGPVSAGGTRPPRLSVAPSAAGRPGRSSPSPHAEHTYPCDAHPKWPHPATYPALRAPVFVAVLALLGLSYSALRSVAGAVESESAGTAALGLGRGDDSDAVARRPGGTVTVTVTVTVTGPRSQSRSRSRSRSRTYGRSPDGTRAAAAVSAGPPAVENSETKLRKLRRNSEPARRRLGPGEEEAGRSGHGAPAAPAGSKTRLLARACARLATRRPVLRPALRPARRLGPSGGGRRQHGGATRTGCLRSEAAAAVGERGRAREAPPTAAAAAAAAERGGANEPPQADDSDSRLGLSLRLGRTDGADTRGERGGGVPVGGPRRLGRLGRKRSRRAPRGHPCRSPVPPPPVSSLPPPSPGGHPTRGQGRLRLPRPGPLALPASPRAVIWGRRAPGRRLGFR